MTRQSESGATAVEHALIVSAIAAVIIAVVVALGSTTSTSYQDSCTRLSTEMGGSC